MQKHGLDPSPPLGKKKNKKESVKYSLLILILFFSKGGQGSNLMLRPLGEEEPEQNKYKCVCYLNNTLRMPRHAPTMS